jgi:hypothetical protein
MKTSRWVLAILGSDLLGACSSQSADEPAPLADDAGAVGVDASAGAHDDAAGDAGTSDVQDGAITFLAAPHLPWPTILDHGGHILDPLRVVTVVAADEPYAPDLQAFGDSIAASSWFAAFASEYGITGTPTHILVKGAHVASGTSFTQVQMNQYIADTVAAASPPLAPDGRTVYVLFLPPGTTLTVNGAPDTTCSRVPYHAPYGTLGDGMAVLTRCPGSFPSQLAMFTAVAAHEIAEAATNPSYATDPAWGLWVADTKTPWQSSVWNEVEMESSVEIGDLCIFTRTVEKGFALQRIFSNAAAAKGGDPCVPASSVPYFGVSPDPKTGGWFSATAGATVNVPLVGWSTAKTADWLVWPAGGKSKVGPLFPAVLTSATTRTVDTHTYATTNNGNALTLEVSIPPTAASGWWGAVHLWSWHADGSGAYVAGEDFGHESVVGFYVP